MIIIKDSIWKKKKGLNLEYISKEGSTFVEEMDVNQEIKECQG